MMQLPMRPAAADSNVHDFHRCGTLSLSDVFWWAVLGCSASSCYETREASCLATYVELQLAIVDEFKFCQTSCFCTPLVLCACP